MPGHESRIKKSILNAKINTIFYVLSLFLAFFSRKIFLDCLGTEFIGLTTTVGNILSFLNLAELGIGLAIGYSLYKPLFNNDKVSIQEIISVLAYLYRIIGILILSFSVITSFFLPLIFSNTGFSYTLIYFIFYSFLFSSLIGYFFNYKQTLLSADQKNYVIIAYFQTTQIIKTIIQLGFAYYTSNLYIWVFIEFIFGIIFSFILNWKVNQVYPWLKSEPKKGKILLKKYPKLIKNTKQIFIHKIGAFAQWQITPILTYTFVNLTFVTLWANYTLLSDKITGVIQQLSQSTEASIGNLIAENDKERILCTYWKLFHTRLLIGAIMTFGIYFCIDPFISIWLGDDYILPKEIVMLLCINTFINVTCNTTGQFLWGYGIFHDTWVPIIQLLSCIGLSSLFGMRWGLFGVLLGNSISLFILMYIWKPIFLFIKGFHVKPYIYFMHLLSYITLFVLIAIFTCFLSLRFEFVIINETIRWLIFTLILLTVSLIIDKHTRALFKDILNTLNIIKGRKGTEET